MTSAVAFGIGVLALGAVYLVVLAGVRSLTVTRQVLTGTGIELNGHVYFVPREIAESELRTWESVIKEILLNQVAISTLVALAVVFVLAVVVGWIVAGRALRPLTAITQVAEDIQANDLTRRLPVDGPDDEVKAMASTFNAMLDRLDEAFRGQRRFLAETSHDLRTPLATIRTNVDVTLADPHADPAAWRETGEVVSRAAARMSDMLDDLLAAARLQVAVAQTTRVDLAEVVGVVTEELSGRAAELSVRLVMRPDPARVDGDRRSLERALANLAENALAAAPSGSAVELFSGRVGDWGYLAVGDRGPGLDPELVAGGRGSRGLGLGIVRDVAAAHGGTLTVADRTDAGSLLVVWIPMGSTDDSHDIPSPPLDLL